MIHAPVVVGIDGTAGAAEAHAEGDGPEETPSVPSCCERRAACPPVQVPPARREAPRPVPA